jgi:hypothetical protein
MADVPRLASNGSKTTPYVVQRTTAPANLKKGDLPMTGNRKSSALGHLLDVFGSAILVATAVESGHRPFDRDLGRLGIDPREFRKIRRF